MPESSCILHGYSLSHYWECSLIMTGFQPTPLLKTNRAWIKSIVSSLFWWRDSVSTFGNVLHVQILPTFPYSSALPVFCDHFVWRNWALFAKLFACIEYTIVPDPLSPYLYHKIIHHIQSQPIVNSIKYLSKIMETNTLTKHHEQKSHLTQNDTHFWVICKHKFLGKFLIGFCHQLFPLKEGHFLWGFTTRRGPMRYFLLFLVLQTKKVRLLQYFPLFLMEKNTYYFFFHSRFQCMEKGKSARSISINR